MFYQAPPKASACRGFFVRLCEVGRLAVNMQNGFQPLIMHPKYLVATIHLPQSYSIITSQHGLCA